MLITGATDSVLQLPINTAIIMKQPVDPHGGADLLFEHMKLIYIY